MWLHPPHTNLIVTKLKTILDNLVDNKVLICIKKTSILKYCNAF